MRGVERKGERIRLVGDHPDPMDHIQAESLAASLAAAAAQARRAAYRREHLCVDCGTQLEPGNQAETCGTGCPANVKDDLAA